ncbi:NUDIX domain-containing protein [Methylovirgula sp. 4M-Z18]|uniref:NUDIX domain-containing protein n=1 Tax=Methylovirgula sp. 4M-Z18 TaxID=2293567 RepID=UPI001FE1097B|nr:NUDIX domain-containing protein [Methylovirgula sp. 4M-Z18]
MHLVFRFSRGMTLGVRAVVLDAEGRVFLVRHSYVPGWHFPGGGVEIGESLTDALAKELREEGNIELTGPAKLHNVYYNRQTSKRDHVALYVVHHFRQTAPRRADAEIVEAGFFARNALPQGTTKATLRRLAEVLDGAKAERLW